LLTPRAVVPPVADPVRGHGTQSGLSRGNVADHDASDHLPSGSVLSSGGLLSGAGAIVTVFDASGTNVGMGTTNSSGTFQFQLTTGGKPLDYHALVTLPDQLDTNWYPAKPPPGANAYLSIVTLSSTDIVNMLERVNIMTDSMKTQIFVGVVDCEGRRIAGATVGAVPASGTVLYVINRQIDPTATSTDEFGLALLANAAPGDLTISATLGTTGLRSIHVAAVAGTLVRAEIGP
jgi:hypothetical protein